MTPTQPLDTDNRKTNQRLVVVQLAVAVVMLWQAFLHRWLSDDAFISFRYAKHWSEGHGLVYNIGEYVEGYTNLLWTIWLGLGMWLGVQPEVLAHLSSLSALAVMLGLLLTFSHRGLSLPFLFIAGMSHIRIFATSGLETQSFLTLIVLFLYALRRQAWIWMWLAMVLGMLTRPEGGLLWACVLPVLWFGGYKQETLKTFVIGLLVLGGLTAWRRYTYDEWLPNTFYAKAQGAQWGQGWLYVGLFFQQYWFVPFGWLAGGLLLRERPDHRLWVQFSLLFSTLYTIHVVRVGGDFMMARFALPFAIPLTMMFGVWLQELLVLPKRRWLVLFATLGLSLTALPPKGLTEVNDGQIGIAGITEESFWYTEQWRQKAQVAGQEMKPMLAGTSIQVVIYGAQAMFAYYADLPYVIEGMSGLTDHELARLPSRDQRIGHGRKATVPYLQSRGVELYIDFRIQQGTHPLNQIQLGSLSGSILSYKKEQMALLRERGAEFQDFEEYLDWYIDTLEIKTPEERERDLTTFARYYFDFNDDPVDQERWRRLNSP